MEYRNKCVQKIGTLYNLKENSSLFATQNTNLLSFATLQSNL